MKINSSQKAKELFDKYFDMKWQTYSNRKSSIKSMTKNAAKQCAILNVEELINERLDFREEATKFNNERIKFLQEVKKEIGLI